MSAFPDLSSPADQCVSIIIPNYNGQGTIAEAVESALNLHYEPKEVIVVDDGSTDDSVVLLRKFGKRIVLLTGPNRGACHARNRGIAAATGAFLQFLDSDDLVDENKIGLQIRHLRETAADISICYGRVIPSSDALAAAYRRKYIGGDPLLFCAKGVLPITAPLHRTSVVRSVGGFDERLSCSQERDLHMRLAASGFSFAQLPKVLFTVRRTVGSVSSNSLKVILNHRSIVDKIVKLLRERESATPERYLALSTMLAADARWLLRNGEVTAAMEYFEMAETLAPRDGVRQAYGRWAYRLRQVLGPIVAEKVLYIFKKWRSS